MIEWISCELQWLYDNLHDNFLGNGMNSHVCVCTCNTIVCLKVVVSGFVYNHFIYRLIRKFIIWTKARLIVI